MDNAVKATRRRNMLLIALAVVVAAACVGAWVYYDKTRGGEAAAQTEVKQPGKGRGGKGGKGGDGGPIPVGTSVAAVGDIPIYLSGLGTVVPMRTVTVRSRVDGELIRVDFAEGQYVKEGQLLAQVDPRPFQVQLDQAEGQLIKDQALLANARLDLERYEALFKQDSIAQQQVATQVSLVRQYEGAVRTDQAAVDNAKLQLSYARITAPITGRLGLRQVDPGNIVHAADANGVVLITEVQPITVIFTLPQDNLPAIMQRIKGNAKLAVEAWDRGFRTKLASGELLTVDNVIDVTTGTVKLRAKFANADLALFPNQFVNARMLLDTRSGVLIIPGAALQRGSQGSFVYVVKDDSTVSVRPVKLGASDGERVAVESGLAAGERVVVDGMDRLREGARVQVGARR
ncbi:MAG TPA: MdtA/MuxA family multidrug efflux RND transporter periplasmic adaptor subunit [Burkholderiales bacterium]